MQMTQADKRLIRLVLLLLCLPFILIAVALLVAFFSFVATSILTAIGNFY